MPPSDDSDVRELHDLRVLNTGHWFTWGDTPAVKATRAGAIAAFVAKHGRRPKAIIYQPGPHMWCVGPVEER